MDPHLPSFQGDHLFLKLAGKPFPLLTSIGCSNINFHWSPIYKTSAPAGGGRWVVRFTEQPRLGLDRLELKF